MHRRSKVDLWLPPGSGDELGRASDQARHIDRAEQFGVNNQREHRIAHRYEPFRDLAHGRAAPGTYVVGLTWCAVLDEQAICPYDVTDIGQVAHDVEVPDVDLGAAGAFGLGDTLGETGYEHRRALPGAGVVEGADTQGRQAVPEKGLQREDVGCGLARAVGRDRPDGRVLREWKVCLGDGTVDVGAAGDEHPAGAGVGAGAQDVQRAEGVDPEDGLSRVPGAPDVAQGGEVVHGIGACPSQHSSDLGGIGDIDRRVAGVVDRHDVVAAGAEVGHEVSADEAAAARDGRLHASDRYSSTNRDAICGQV